MPGVVARIEGVDLSALSDVLDRVRTALDALDGLTLSDLDPSSMLAGLDDVVAGLTNGVPDAEELAGLAETALSELTALLSLPDLPGLGEAAGALRVLTDRLGALASLRPGEGGITVDGLLGSLGGTFDLAGIIDEIAARAVGLLDGALPDELESTVQVLARLAPTTRVPTRSPASSRRSSSVSTSTSPSG